MITFFSNEGIQPDPSKVSSINNLKRPDSPAEVRSFLGMINYVGKFLPNLAENTKILRDLTLKNSVYEWTEKHEEAFNFLKQQLSKSTSLSYFDINRTTHIYVEQGQVVYEHC